MLDNTARTALATKIIAAGHADKASFIALVGKVVVDLQSTYADSLTLPRATLVL